MSINIEDGGFDWDEFDAKMGTEKINILKDLPYEVQFNENDLCETFQNLYHWNRNHDSIIKDFPSPFYEDLIISQIENKFNITINDKDFYKELDNYFR